MWGGETEKPLTPRKMRSRCPQGSTCQRKEGSPEPPPASPPLLGLPAGRAAPCSESSPGGAPAPQQWARLHPTLHVKAGRLRDEMTLPHGGRQGAATPRSARGRCDPLCRTGRCPYAPSTGTEAPISLRHRAAQIPGTR